MKHAETKVKIVGDTRNSHATGGARYETLEITRIDAMCDAVHSIADGTKQRCRKSDYLSRSDDRKCRYFQDMINSAHDIRERVVRLRPSNRKIVEIKKVSA